MAVSPASYGPSSYGERPPLQGYRRSFTLPARQLSLHERAALDKSDADEEVLFSHHSTRTYSFTPPTDAISSSNNSPVPHDTDYPIDAVEVLPWRSRTETLVASGPLVIEKVRGSAKFLKTGEISHALMRNSQCWCVDNESKFVLRKGKLQYYRIELPSNTDEDKEKVKELISTFQKILRYERTPCPFIRAFHVDLPDDAITPRRKGAWKKRDSLLTPPETETPTLRRKKNFRNWSLQGPHTSTFESSPPATPTDPHKTYEDRSRQLKREQMVDRDTTPSSMASSEATNSQRAASRDREGHGDSDTGHETSDLVEQAQDEAQESLSNVRNDSAVGEAPDSPSNDTSAQPESNIKEIANTDSVLALEQRVSGIEENKVITSKTISQQERGIEDEDTEPPPHPAEDHREVAEDRMATGAQESLLDQNNSDNIPIDEEHGRDTLPVHPSEASSIDLDGLDNHSQPDLANRAAETDTQIARNSPTSETNDISASIGHQEVKPPSEDTAEEAVKTMQIPDSIATMNGQEERHNFSEEDTAVDSEMLSRISSLESFHTSASSDGELPREAESFEQANGGSPEGLRPSTLQHKRGLSEMTITMSRLQDGTDEDDIFIDGDQLAMLTPKDEVVLPISDTGASTSVSPMIYYGLQHRLQSRRSTSPPPPVTLISPQHPSQGSHLASAILQKAATVAVVKPIAAVVVLVHILIRIAQGATFHDLVSGDLFRTSEQGRRNASSSSHFATTLDVDEEDDFGVPLRGRTPSADLTHRKQSRDDDADSMFDVD